MNRFLKYFFVAWAINLALFFILTAYLGGDAINGKIIDGRYFTGEPRAPNRSQPSRFCLQRGAFCDLYRPRGSGDAARYTRKAAE